MDKTFEAMCKLEDVELELHRLKNALEMMTRAYEVKKEWVGLTDVEIKNIVDCGRPDLVNIKKAEQLLKDKNAC